LTRAFCRLSIKRVCVRGVAASISGDFTPNSRGVVLHRLSEEEEGATRRLFQGSIQSSLTVDKQWSRSAE
jgi:hypothetical protein